MAGSLAEYISWGFPIHCWAPPWSAAAAAAAPSTSSRLLLLFLINSQVAIASPNKSPPSAAPTAMPAIAPVDSLPWPSAAAGRVLSEGAELAPLVSDEVAGDVEVGRVVADVVVVTRSDDWKLSWNIGANRTISRVRVSIATARPAFVAVEVVTVDVMISGNVARANTICDPEHVAVVTAVWVPVEITATHVLPLRLSHVNPLRIPSACALPLPPQPDISPGPRLTLGSIPRRFRQHLV